MRTEIRATFTLALPMILGQGTQMAMHAIDTAMVGRLGVDELAASAMGNNAAVLFFLTGIAIGTTVPILAARAFGAKDRGRMNLVLRHGLTVSFIYGVASVAIFWAVSPLMLPWFGSAELARAARPYAMLLIVSLVPALLLQNLRGFTEAQNRPWLPMGNILLGVALNVLFNYAFIYGHFGFPALGLPGAALGTLLARCLMLVHFIWVLQRHGELKPAASAWRPVPRDAAFYGDYLRLALPTAAMLIVWLGNGVVVAMLMGRLGPAALASHEIVRQLSSLLFTFSVAFQAAIAIRVAQAAGGNDPAALRRVAWSGVLALATAMSFAGIALFLARNEIPRWFIADAAEGSDVVIALATQILGVVTFGVIAEALNLACVGVFRGLANVRAAATVYLIGMWIVGLPLAYFLGFIRAGGGVDIWLGLVAANWATTLVLVVLLARTQPFGVGRFPAHRSAVTS
jgi:multidrug resistance protein, MATE family